MGQADDVFVGGGDTASSVQAGFGTIGGSIPLGALGGDRVVVSPDLKSTLMNRIQPYRRSYAKRTATKSAAFSGPIPTRPGAPAVQSAESTVNVIVALFGLKRSSDDPSDTAQAA
jgi:hypothetical protein